MFFSAFSRSRFAYIICSMAFYMDIILNHLDVTMGYIVDWSRSSLPHTKQVLLSSIFVDADQPQFKCFEFVRIG